MQKIKDDDYVHTGVVCIRNNLDFTYRYYTFDYSWELKQIIHKYIHIKRKNKYLYKLISVVYYND